jgi:hypothetical protein
MILIEYTVSILGHKQIPIHRLQVFYNGQRMISQVDPHFPVRAFAVHCGGEIGAYTAQLNFHR